AAPFIVPAPGFFTTFFFTGRARCSVGGDLMVLDGFLGVDMDGRPGRSRRESLAGEWGEKAERPDRTPGASGVLRMARAWSARRAVSRTASGATSIPRRRRAFRPCFSFHLTKTIARAGGQRPSVAPA